MKLHPSVFIISHLLTVQGNNTIKGNKGFGWLFHCVVVLIDLQKETEKIKRGTFGAPSPEEGRDNEDHLSGEVL